MGFTRRSNAVRRVAKIALFDPLLSLKSALNDCGALRRVRRFLARPENDRVEKPDGKRHIEERGPGEPKILGEILGHVVVSERHHNT